MSRVNKTEDDVQGFPFPHMGPLHWVDSSLLWIGTTSRYPKKVCSAGSGSLALLPELAAAWGEQGSFTLAAKEPFTLPPASSQQALELQEAGCLASWKTAASDPVFFSP